MPVYCLLTQREATTPPCAAVRWNARTEIKPRPNEKMPPQSGSVVRGKYASTCTSVVLVLGFGGYTNENTLTQNGLEKRITILT